MVDGPGGRNGGGRADEAGAGGGSGAADERWYLNDQREFLIRSLADAATEHDAGDLTDEDFALLTARDQRKLEEVEEDLARLAPVEVGSHSASEVTGENDAAGDEAAPAVGLRRMSRRRVVGIVLCCALIIAGVVILVDHAISPRLSGQAVSGSIVSSKEDLIEEELQQAAIDNNNGQLTQALVLYKKVLVDDPTDPTALAQSGWLEWTAGATSKSTKLRTVGQDSEEAAIRVAPNFWGGHLFLGLILYNQKSPNLSAAVMQFNQFLADGPPAGEVQAVGSLIGGAYKAAGVPIPAVLASPSG
jgi:tetratricopeptide (TPR) repeat protein